MNIPYSLAMARRVGYTVVCPIILPDLGHKAYAITVIGCTHQCDGVIMIQPQLDRSWALLLDERIETAH